MFGDQRYAQIGVEGELVEDEAWISCSQRDFYIEVIHYLGALDRADDFTGIVEVGVFQQQVE